MQYDDTNRGVLFRNDKQNDRQPDYTGKINVDGVDKRISAWVKESSKGTKFLSISVSDLAPKQEVPTPQMHQMPGSQPAGGLNDDIPF